MDIWHKIIAELKSPDPDDRVWLMYSANYLFRTQGVRWTMDPLVLKFCSSEAPAMDVAGDLKDLDFIPLTSQYKDHLGFDLLRSLPEIGYRSGWQSTPRPSGIRCRTHRISQGTGLYRHSFLYEDVMNNIEDVMGIVLEKTSPMNY